MTETVRPLRKLMNMKKYKGSKKLTWTDEALEAFHYCRVAVSNCQELYFLEDTETPILQTDAPDHGIGGYLYMIVNHQVRVIRLFSKSLVGSQLNWSAREKECYGIYYGVELFEDLLDLTYINVTFTDKVLRWKMYLQGKDFDLFHVVGKEEHQFVPDALSRLCINHIPPPPTLADKSIVAFRPVMNLPQDVYDRIADIHNSLRGHVGLKLCKRRFKMIRKQRIKAGLVPEDAIPDRMINEFLRQCQRNQSVHG